MQSRIAGLRRVVSTAHISKPLYFLFDFVLIFQFTEFRGDGTDDNLWAALRHMFQRLKST